MADKITEVSSGRPGDAPPDVKAQIRGAVRASGGYSNPARPLAGEDMSLSRAPEDPTKEAPEAAGKKKGHNRVNTGSSSTAVSDRNTRDKTREW